MDQQPGPPLWNGQPLRPAERHDRRGNHPITVLVLVVIVIVAVAWYLQQSGTIIVVRGS